MMIARDKGRPSTHNAQVTAGELGGLTLWQARQRLGATRKSAMLDIAYSMADQNVGTTKSIGIYNFSLHLARHLAVHPQLNRLTVFSNSTVSPSLQFTARTRIQDFNCPLRNKLGRIWWDQWALYRWARATGHRWLFLPKGFCSFVSRPRFQIAAFVHDIMDDFYRRHYPSFVPRLESAYFARALEATLRQSRMIFTNTNFSKSELLGWARRRGLPEPKFIVAGYGFETPAAGRTEKENRILLCASKMPHKRTDIAIRYLTHWLQSAQYEGPIDCIGILSPHMAKPEGARWNWIGRVPPARGRELMRRARAVIYASDYEGFGMPPVEAVLEGSCPVFSDIPALREVMGEAGYRFSNQSEESFLEAMNQALATPPETIRAWSKTLLYRHNWPAVTDRIVQALANE
jgi:glycosyltransferase involved in cell wall biosynthesis